jgi:hypothetical protein
VRTAQRTAPEPPVLRPWERPDSLSERSPYSARFVDALGRQSRSVTIAGYGRHARSALIGADTGSIRAKALAVQIRAFCSHELQGIRIAGAFHASCWQSAQFSSREA